jgi:hypothetical protein
MRMSADDQANTQARLDDPLTAIASALSHLRYGVVQVTVHDGKVMQIEVTERQRFKD